MDIRKTTLRGPLRLTVQGLPGNRAKVWFEKYKGPRGGNFGDEADGWVNQMQTHPSVRFGSIEKPPIGKGLGRWTASNGLILASRATPCVPLYVNGEGLGTATMAGRDNDADEWSAFTVPGLGRTSDSNVLVTGNLAQVARLVEAVREYNKQAKTAAPQTSRQA